MLFIHFIKPIEKRCSQYNNVMTFNVLYIEVAS